jgi:hypothetical protein
MAPAEGKRRLKVYFSPAVTRRNDLIGDALKDFYEVEEVQSAPDVSFVSDTNNTCTPPRGKTNILVAIENTYPDFRKYQAGLTYLNTKDRRNLRLPNHVLISRPEELIKSRDFADSIAQENREFCAFVASNMNVFRTRRRVEFFKALDNLESVKSGGKLLNNTGCRVKDLQAFYRRFRFCMAFENQAFPGYTTEKMVYAMSAGCIPIYWGNPDIVADFNPASFIDVRSFASDSRAIEHILAVWKSPELAREYLDQPYLHGNAPGYWHDRRRVARFIRSIIDGENSEIKSIFAGKLHNFLMKCLPYTGERFVFTASQIYLTPNQQRAWD